MNLLTWSLVLLFQISSLFAYSIIDCDFEQDTNPLCGYNDLGAKSWTRANSNSNLDPGHDHTCSAAFRPFPSRKCGNWVSTIPSRNYSGTQEFSLVSKPMSPTNGPSCLRFWYHFFGLEKAQFDVKISNNKQMFNSRTIWQKLTPQSNNWIQAYVNVPRQYSSSFYVIFHAMLTSKYHDTVGLDDITFSYGPCPATPDCDLETDLCSWTSTGAVRTNGTPFYDHTVQSNLGHYLLNQGNNQKSLISASIKNLTSTFTNSYYSYCFKFWYFFMVSGNGDSDSYIQINVTTYPYYYKKLSIQDALADNLVNGWKPMFFSIPNPRRRSSQATDPQVVITLFGKGNTQVAIDDLLVSNRACETMGECDFESDFCGWSNSGQYLWLRNTGGTKNSFKKAPPTDTTTHTANGWYAMVPAEYLKTFYYASLQSPPLYSRSSYNCFAFNYWAVGYNSRTPALTVSFIDLTKYGRRIASVQLNTSMYSQWQRFHYSIPKMPARYMISISTSYQVRGLNSDIAIDDISLSYTDCRRDGRPTTPRTTPIPYTERKWDCNFEYKCSQWTSDSNWKITSYRKAPSSLNPPRSDHTRKTPEGGYLLYMPPGQLSPNQTVISTFNSTVLTSKQHCLTFWYYDSSENIFELGVYLLSTKYPNFNGRLATVKRNVANRAWKMVKVDVGAYIQGASLMIKFSASTYQNGSFAIDDIKLTPLMCGHVDDYVYTFDSMENLEVTRIAPLNGFMGGIHYYNQRNLPNAPTRDHTTGTGNYFLFMNRPTDYNTTYKDQLVIDNLPAMRYQFGMTKTRCFHFAYQIYGNASFNVFVSQVDSNTFYYPIFSSYGYHSSWVMAQVPYNAYYEHKLVFEMSKPFDTRSYIALDDLAVSSSNCKQSVECDFDDDTCSYDSLYSSKEDYDFARFVGPPNNVYWPGPAYDHTKRGYGGGYLYMTGYPSTTDRYRTSALQTPIESYRYQIPANYCVSFWSQITAPDATFSVYLGLYGGKDFKQNSQTVLLTELKQITETKWTRHFVELDRKLFAKYNEFNLRLNGRTTKAKSMIAIDDFELVRSPCDYTNKFTCGDGTKIVVDKLCNFKKDCSDGSDEKNCGECSFESSNCGWLNETSRGTFGYIGSWVPVSAKSGLGPNTDGSGNANGHYLLLKKSRQGNSMFISGTKLTRNYRDFKTQFKDAYFTCTMTFDYYLNSNRPKFSAAVLEVTAGNDEDSSVLKGHYQTKSDSWQKSQIFIGGYASSFVVQFMGSSFATNETVALDNIQFHNCSIPDPIALKANCPASAEIMCNTTRVCIDPGDLCDFEDNCGDNWDENFAMCANAANPGVAPNCAFEKSLEDCGFTMESDEKYFNWQFQKGHNYDFYLYNMPSADHTTKDHNGQFLTLRTYQKKYIGKHVRLYSPFMYSQGDACWMRFFYWNNGNYSINDHNQLRVWVQYADGNNADSGTLFSSNSYLPNWIKAKVKYSSSSPFRFVFDGQLSDIRGSISMDDVSYSGTCMSSPKSKRTPGSHSAAVTIILVILLVCIVGGVGFFLFRKHQSGELQPYIDRVATMLPSRKADQMTFANANYNETTTASTSTAAADK